MIPLFLFQFGLAVATTISIFYGGYYHCLFIPLPDEASRAEYTLRWAFPPLLVLLSAILSVGIKRVATPAVNPLANNEHFVNLEKCFLANTLEQLVVWVLATGILVTYLSREEMRLVPLYSVAFVIGRVLFRIGYGIDPMKRGWGMWTNLLSTFYVIGFTVYCMYTRGFLSSSLTIQTVGKPEL